MATATSSFTGSENPLSEGSAWSCGQGEFDTVEKVSGVVRAVPVFWYGVARYAASTFDDDHFSEITLKAPSGGGVKATAGALTRLDNSGTASTCYTAFHARSADQVTISRIDNDVTVNALGAAFSVSAYADGDLLRLESSGGTHTLVYNNVSQGSRSDSTYLTGGNPGIIVEFAEDAIDAWYGGDLGGIIAELGQTSETDTPQSISRVKTSDINLSSEDDTAGSLGRLKTQDIGSTSETDLAITIPRPIVLIGQPSETNSAQPIGRNKTYFIRQVVSGDGTTTSRRYPFWYPFYRY